MIGAVRSKVRRQPIQLRRSIGHVLQPSCDDDFLGIQPLSAAQLQFKHIALADCSDHRVFDARYKVPLKG